MAIRAVRFRGHTHAELAGLVHSPDDNVEPNAWILFAHCFTCSKNSKAAAAIARSLTAQNFGVLRFDFTGLGDSDGAFEDTDFSSNIEDLVAAAQWLEQEHRAPTILVGHSLGGAAVVAAAHQLPKVKLVATIAAPFDPTDVTRHFVTQLDEIEHKGKAVVSLADRPFTITQSFVDDLHRHNPEERVRTLNKALLILHSPKDQTVKLRNATQYFTAAKHPKSFVSLDEANHLLTRRKDAELAAEIIGSMARYYA